MSKEELRRGGILARVKAEELRLKDAAVMMRVSGRQAKRLWKRYKAGGTAALQHRAAGRRSNRARPAKERKKILVVVRGKYNGFGPTLAAEHLASEEKQKIHPETVERQLRVALRAQQVAAPQQLGMVRASHRKMADRLHLQRGQRCSAKSHRGGAHAVCRHAKLPALWERPS